MSVRSAYSSARPCGGVLQRYLSRFDEAEVLRCVWLGLIIGSLAVIGFDLKALHAERAALDLRTTGSIVQVEPVRTASQPQAARESRQSAREALLAPPLLRFVLGPDGVLSAVGSIEIGAARRLAEELERHGGNVRTLSLNSPGGSLDDAMAMGRLAREHGLAVHIRAGAVCASSCPLVLAGGVTRNVDEGATIGLHQFYAHASQFGGPAQAVSDAQVTTARIARFLDEMGVDPALWLHALETPPRGLYRLSRQEMTRYRLVTRGSSVASR